jgi:L-rhamnose-H+ transport protein
MHNVIWFAAVVVLIGGLMQGSFAVPMRLARRWTWENTWMVYSIVGLLLIPWAAARITIANALHLYQSVSSLTLIETGLFGLGWGIANVLFGVAVPIVGMAVSFAVVVGMSASLGSVVPLLLSHASHLIEPAGLTILAGVILACFGVTLLGAAGRSREIAEVKSTRMEPGSQTRITIGFVLCVLAGFLAPMLNFSFAFGSEIRDNAIRMGAPASQAVNAIWVVALAGGFISNGGYCAVLLTKNKTWSRFWERGALSQCGLSFAMGILWTGGLLLYGWGASNLGALGPSIGWPIFQASIIVISSVLGIAMGEWKNAKRRTMRINYLGLAVLVLSIATLSLGNRM